MKNKYLKFNIQHLTFLLFIVHCSLFTIHCSAQWIPTNGPGRGYLANEVTCLALKGDTIFAGTLSGVFSSTNNGTSWDSLGLSEVNCFAISGKNIFAGTAHLGVFISANNGISWTHVSDGLPYDSTFKFYYNITSIAISGINIFAGNDLGSRNGVFLSTNNGASWSQRNNGLTDTIIQSLAISRNNIFAGVGVRNLYGGVYLSTDNGTNWTSVNNGLPNSGVGPIAIKGDTLFAETGEGGGVFLSTNNGASWASVNNGLPPDAVISSFAISGSIIFAGTINTGIFLSTNNGANWTNVGLLDYKILALLISRDTLFAGINGYSVGVWKRALWQMFPGINELKIESGEWKIYPNPVTDFLNIEFNSSNQHLNESINMQIINLQGTKVFNQQIQKSKVQVDVSYLPDGIYIIKITNAQTITIKKIIKL